MTNRQLVVGLAATFIGLTVGLAVSGIVVHPILLFVAVPFGLAAYFLWLHASGRLADRIRSHTQATTTRDRVRARQRARAKRNRADAFVGSERTGNGSSGSSRHRTSGRTDRHGHRSRTAHPSGSTEPTLAEAYATLELDPNADDVDVRTAYREKAKSLHPDTDGGDEASFKELTRAYDRLREAD